MVASDTSGLTKDGNFLDWSVDDYHSGRSPDSSDLTEKEKFYMVYTGGSSDTSDLIEEENGLYWSVVDYHNGRSSNSSNLTDDVNFFLWCQHRL